MLGWVSAVIFSTILANMRKLSSDKFLRRFDSSVDNFGFLGSVFDGSKFDTEFMNYFVILNNYRCYW